MKLMQCVKCGKVVEATKNRKYCPDCAAFVKLQQTRAFEKRRVEERKKRRERAAGADRRSDAQAQSDELGIMSLAGKSLSRVAAEARVLGLNYGDYSTLVRSGDILPWLADRGIDWREAFLQIGSIQHRRTCQ